MRHDARRSLFKVLPRVQAAWQGPAQQAPGGGSSALQPPAVAAAPNDQIWADLMALFADPAVDEILVNGTHGLWLVKQGLLVGQAPPFTSNSAFSAWLMALARREGVRLDPLCGTAGGSLPGEGFRWHCVLPPLSQDGPLFSLRRHRFEALSVADFAGDPAVIAAVRAAVTARSCLLIAGPTGAGKTSLLVALLRAHAAEERIVITESLAELPRISPCCIRLLERRANLENVGEVGMARLVSEALRLRPDRLVVGEIRGAEARVFVETLLTGHAGMMATIHAGSASEALARLRCLAGPGHPGPGSNLHVVVMERGQPPRIRSLAHAAADW